MAHLNLELIEKNHFSFDQKGFKLSADNRHVPFDDQADILSLRVLKQRHEGQFFYAFNADHSDIDTWQFVGGIADENLIKKSGGGGGGGDTNFANTNLTADGDRTHNFAGHKANMTGLSEFNLSGQTLENQVIPYDDQKMNYGRDEDADHFYPLENENAESLDILMSIDGVETSVTFTKEGEGTYTAPTIAGDDVFPISYTGQLINLVEIGIEAKEGQYYPEDEDEEVSPVLALINGKIVKVYLPSILEAVEVDGTTITGSGQSGDPLVAATPAVEVDGTTITGSGQSGDPLVAATPAVEVDGTTITGSGQSGDPLVAATPAVEVDGTTITGSGQSGDPLVAATPAVEVDGTTITGSGQSGDPLVAATPLPLFWFRYNVNTNGIGFSNEWMNSKIEGMTFSLSSNGDNSFSLTWPESGVYDNWIEASPVLISGIPHQVIGEVISVNEIKFRVVNSDNTLTDLSGLFFTGYAQVGFQLV